MDHLHTMDKPQDLHGALEALAVMCAQFQLEFLMGPDRTTYDRLCACANQIGSALHHLARVNDEIAQEKGLVNPEPN